MNDHDNRLPREAARSTGSLVSATLLSAVLLVVLTASCSIVFRSSIQGTIIDLENWDEGTTTGVSDAKVFLYTDEAARDEDFAAYADGDETTLPDGAARTERLYFQSTVTDADGGYDFTGFVWKTLFPQYGKTADRNEVFLLVYHPNYGLWKNPTPLYVVSDVTNQLDYIKVEDLWNSGRLAGTVLDWKDDEGLRGVTVLFYVAESWTYDESGAFTNVVYPTAASDTTTTDDDGYWSTTVSFPMQPDRVTHAGHGNAPVRVTFALDNYRANDPYDSTSLNNSPAGLTTTVDLDEDGKDADHGDYSDAFVSATLSDDELTTLNTPLSLQRWQFSSTVRGRIADGSDYLDGVKVTLELPDGTIYTAYSETQTTGEIEQKGVFNLGTVAWEIGDASNELTGQVAITILLDGAAPAVGEITSLLPDETVVLNLDPTP